MSFPNWKKITLRNTIVIHTLTLLFSTAVYSQADLPKVIPPSPEASALFRFQDYPMDYSTGLPSISVPLYEVKSGSLSVPISISYHASGRRVSDQDGPIALGWSLNAGGMISRTVYGDPDFGTPTRGTYYFPYPFRTTGLSNVNDYQYFEKLLHYDNVDANILPWMESEYDIFSYNFGNNSGKFIFKDNNNVKTPVLLPTKPYIITPYYTFRGLTGIDIIDDKGNLYKFAQTEESGPDNDYAVTGLLITQIISADKTDTIGFQYTGFAQWNTTFSQTRTYTGSWTLNQPAPSNPVSNYENVSHGTYQIKRLTQINFKQGKVVFNLVSGIDKIDNIQIKDLNNQVIKTIQLSRSVMDALTEGGSGTNPLASQVNNKLNTVTFKDNTGTAIENYSFEYFPTKFSPNSPTSVNGHYCDWWGYYNASGLLNMIPDYTITGGVNVSGGSFNREPDLDAVKSGVLKKITFPTGGFSEFSYELNKYADPNYTAGKNGPGLRVSQIVVTDLNGNSNIKTYKYGAGEVGYGVLDLKPDINNMGRYEKYLYNNIQSFSPLYGGTYDLYTFNSGFNSSLSALVSRPVIYTEVAEYNGTPSNNSGKTIYKYDNNAWAPSGMPVYGIPFVVKKHIYNWNYCNNPSLKVKTDYKSEVSANGQLEYRPKKELYNFYTLNNTDDIVGLHVQRLQVYPQTSKDFTYNYYIEKYVTQLQNQDIYTFSDYHIPVATKDLTLTIETNYGDDNITAVSNVTYFTYNNKQLISQVKKIESDGSSTITDIKYPFDYTGNSLLTQMSGTSLNMLNYPVEQIESSVNGSTTTPVKSVRTNYYNWGTTPAHIAPQTIEVKKGNNAYETRLRYSAYDNNGNPLNVSKELDTKIAYIWDYNKELPIAEITNASSTEVAYTSFEADGAGNWTGITTANIVSNTTGITGTKYYTLNTTGVSIAGLSSTKKYTVTYWSKNGAYTVSGASDAGYPKNIRTVTLSGVSWTLWEHRVGSTTSITVSGTGAIDELRLCPADAQMSTYTFVPLIGMSTKNDANNRIAYYEYDPFGRLKLVKDMNGHVLKTMDYKYRSSTP
ncbi:MAG: hypothetical protein QM802_22105 [Agriterribacter sp.]